MTKALIEPAELAANISRYKILDASYGVPDAAGAFTRGHIGDAQFFDIDAVADPHAPYAHTLPAPEAFAAAVGAMGIGNDDAVVVYDQNGMAFAAARVWWMFRAMGHENVRVLNGGLPAWRMAGLELVPGAATTPAPKPFTAAFNPNLYRSFDDMAENDGSDTVIDARGAPRFQAMMRGPDGDAVQANIPGSLNQPFDTLLEPTGRMKGDDAVAALLFPHITPGNRMVATCGSGVTACVLALGFHQAGFPEVAVFDGSWTEWSDRNSLR